MSTVDVRGPGYVIVSTVDVRGPGYVTVSMADVRSPGSAREATPKNHGNP